MKEGKSLPTDLASLQPFAMLPHSATLGNRDLDKALGALGSKDYSRMVGPSEFLSKSIGNSYAASIHANLLCLIASQGAALEGKRVGAFSYGSGAMATLMTMEGGDGAALENLKKRLSLESRVAERKECSPEEYVEAMAMRERNYGKLGCSPAGSVDNVVAGAYYLSGVNAAGVRTYSRK